MALDFRQVHEQIKKIGENALVREQQIRSLRDKARALLEENAQKLQALRQKAERAGRLDTTLRCALPVNEPLNASFPLPIEPASVTLLAADGSQINPDRHASIEYCLVNVGAIRMHFGAAIPPETTVVSRLLYDDQLYTPSGQITEASLALTRDLNERTLLASLAEEAEPPVITFMDGQMELWGSRTNEGAEAAEFQKSLEAYKKLLGQMCSRQVTVAGYIDKPAADLVVRLLEIASTPENELQDLRSRRPLRGVRDRDLFVELLQPGERSAVFAIQSRLASFYQDELALHFFYLNVGRPGHPWLSRVEIPAWVADDSKMLDDLQAVLVHQCKVMGSRPYPYLLHRAHEAAVVTLQEQEQVTQMISHELRRRGVSVGEQSYKQSAKGLAGRTRYEA